MNTKKTYFRNINTKIKNLVLSGTVSMSTTHKQPEKASLGISKMSKLKKHSVDKTKSKWKLPICDNFIETKTLQREFASATIATLVALNK